MPDKQTRFVTLVNALSADLYRYAYWLCGNDSLAEDLVQETFLRAWRALDTLKDEKSAKSWLFTIVRNEHARLYATQLPEFVDIEEVELPAPPRDCDPESRLEMQKFYKAIWALEPEYREPLVLQVLGGFNGDEIATQLNLNKNTVMTRLHRARRQLQHKLNHGHPTTDHQVEQPAAMQ